MKSAKLEWGLGNREDALKLVIQGLNLCSDTAEKLWMMKLQSRKQKHNHLLVLTFVSIESQGSRLVFLNVFKFLPPQFQMFLNKSYFGGIPSHALREPISPTSPHC